MKNFLTFKEVATRVDTKAILLDITMNGPTILKKFGKTVWFILNQGHVALFGFLSRFCMQDKWKMSLMMSLMSFAT